MRAAARFIPFGFRAAAGTSSDALSIFTYEATILSSGIIREIRIRFHWSYYHSVFMYVCTHARSHRFLRVIFASKNDQKWFLRPKIEHIYIYICLHMYIYVYIYIYTYMPLSLIFSSVSHVFLRFQCHLLFFRVSPSGLRRANWRWYCSTASAADPCW